MASVKAQSILMDDAFPLHTPAVEIEELSFEHSRSPSAEKPFSSPPATPFSGPTRRDHDYNLSGSVYDDGNDTTDVDYNAPNDEEDLNVQSAGRRHPSGATSISSFPASILHQEIEDASGRDVLSTPTRSPVKTGLHDGFHSGFGNKISSPRSARGHVSGFRNPSSVREMQMRDELYDDSDRFTPQHTRSGSRMSHYSQSSLNSAGKSPTKRSSRSEHSSPRKPTSKLRKEFPLVLLHCTLLPPATALHANIYDEDLLAMLLPEKYRKRWILLQDRLLKNSEIRARGILIPHPQEDYELLEERILESLDLEKPRIRNNHFLKHGAQSEDSGFDSASQTEEDSDADLACHTRCPDCGRKMSSETEQDQKWEIKVYAANGLMRVGAWSAAWREMEKVDVELSVWLPEDVRHEMENRLAAFDLHEHEHKPTSERQEQPDKPENIGEDAREREIYGSTGRHNTEERFDRQHEHSNHQNVPATPGFNSVGQTQLPIMNLEALVFKHIKGFLQDRRNVLISFLSFVVLFSAVWSPMAQRDAVSGVALAISSSTQVLTTTITAVSTSTLIEKVSESVTVTSILATDALSVSTTIASSSDIPVPTQISSLELGEGSQSTMPPSIEFTQLAESDSRSNLDA